VFDAAEADGYLYIVMELVEGRSLGDVLADAGELEPGQATAIAASVLAALGEAHTVGIVHRDIKPSNIMVSYDGTVKLLDFGIARRLDDLANDLTGVGEIVGTPTYLAPEQLEGRPTTAATDLYAVGVVLFEMLAGAAPFHGDSPAATALSHVNAPVPDVRSLRPDVPASLAVTIRKAMAKDPAQRYRSAAAMRAALTEGAADLTADLRSSAQEPTQVLAPVDYRQRRRRPWWLAGVAALAVAGVVVWNLATGIFSFITSGDPPESRSAVAAPTSSSVAMTTTTPPTTAPTTTAPATIAGVIAALQANPAAYARQHTTAIVDELIKIEQGDAPGERAADLLNNVAEWVDNADVSAATLTLLEPVLTPLIATQVDSVDEGGHGNGGDGHGNGGNGNGHGNGGNGHGNGGGHGNGHNKKV
jgi:serine/threonine protein kinase